MKQTQRCSNCSGEYVFDDVDSLFLARFEVPAPPWCPDCRQLRRLQHLNELRLFRRACDATGQAIISNHPQYAPYPVYSQEHWYSDTIDNTRFGRSFDFSRGFFEQFAELSAQVPRPALFTDYTRDENSAYTNYAGKNKNCYLIFDSDECWDCLYSYSINNCKNSLDCYRGEKLELCYEAIDCSNCYDCSFIQNCSDCSESSYVESCIGVRKSLFCINLRQKEYYLLNRPASPAEIASVKERMRNPREYAEFYRKFEQLALTLPQRATYGNHNEECTGNYLTHCKNAHSCFDCRQVWDGRYIYQAFMPVKDVMDCNEVGDGELLYECSAVGYNAYNCRFSMNCLNQITNLTYCDMCFLGCKDLFGCVGLKRKSHCILNQQYSEREYRELTERIVRHMKRTEEWGEFFPAKLSPFAYNHSLAHNFYPLEKHETLALGFAWAEDPASSQVADGASCTSCAKNFRVTAEEQHFYQSQGLEQPEHCFFCRHQRRLEKRAPRILIESHCDNCQAPIAGQLRRSARKVFCNNCFQNSTL